jgi:hypothetical protein
MKRKLALLAMAAAVTTAHAAVERIQVVERVPFAPGVTFGEVGAYEKIRGIAYYALDPKAAANASIVDLKKAPRDKKGRVLFSSEFVLLRPTGAADHAAV